MLPGPLDLANGRLAGPVAGTGCLDGHNNQGGSDDNRSADGLGPGRAVNDDVVVVGRMGQDFPDHIVPRELHDGKWQIVAARSPIVCRSLGIGVDEQ